MTNTANTNALIIPGAPCAPCAPVDAVLHIPGASPIHVAAANPRAHVAADVADRAAAAMAAAVTGGIVAETIQTWRGNYIVPASKSGDHVCPTCATSLPVTKFPTRAPHVDGTVTRDFRSCRACVAARRRTGSTSPVTAAHDTAIDRMAATWDGRPANRIPTATVESADVTDRAMGGTGIPSAAAPVTA